MKNTVKSDPTKTKTADLQHQLYLKMKSDLQAQVVDPELWYVLKRKFKKSSASTSSCRDDTSRKRDHDKHQGDDGPPEGGENNNKNGMHVLRIKLLMKMRIEATLRDMMSNQFKDAEEYAYHLEQSKNYIDNQTVWESRQEDIR
ncbi:hypothetical protein Tco_1143344 [Tanacetum coccineum]